MLDHPTPPVSRGAHLDDLHARLTAEAEANRLLAPLLALIATILRRLIALLDTIATPQPPAEPHLPPAVRAPRTPSPHPAPRRTRLAANPIATFAAGPSQGVQRQDAKPRQGRASSWRSLALVALNPFAAPRPDARTRDPPFRLPACRSRTQTHVKLITISKQ